MTTENELIDALKSARTPRNQRLVEHIASDPVGVKESSSMCARCEKKPCQDGELCASVIVDERDLLSEIGRDQAFRYVEGGMKRLQITDEADFRVTDDARPNTFVNIRSRQAPQFRD